MPTTQKTESVKNLREKIAGTKAIIFADYQKLTSNQVNELRAKLREVNADVDVSKNTLLKIALKEEDYNIKELETELKGPTATITAHGDSIEPIKALFDFIKKAGLPRIKAGFFENTFTTAEMLEALSKLPSKKQLLGQLVGGLKSPLSGLVNVLGGSQKKLVYALSAIAKSKGGVVHE